MLYELFLMNTIRYVGKLVGRYYDSKGNPTKYLKGVEAKAARGAQLLEKQKKEEAKQPSCNSRWSQDEGGQVCHLHNFKDFNSSNWFTFFYYQYISSSYVQEGPISLGGLIARVLLLAITYLYNTFDAI